MITITIKTENEAFQVGNRRSEVARILRDLAGKIEDYYPLLVPRDINGNAVGSVHLTGEDRSEL